MLIIARTNQLTGGVERMTTLDLEPIKARLAAATPGPWDFHVLPQSVGITVATIHSEQGPRETRWTVDLPPEIGGMGTRADAEMIAHAPEDIAALVAEVERLREQVEAVREHHVPVDANYYAATVTECCSCPGPWPCPTIRALDGELTSCLS